MLLLPFGRKKMQLYFFSGKDVVGIYEAAGGELLEHRIFITYIYIFIPRVKCAFLELFP